MIHSPGDEGCAIPIVPIHQAFARRRDLSTALEMALPGRQWGGTWLNVVSNVPGPLRAALCLRLHNSLHMQGLCVAGHDAQGFVDVGALRIVDDQVDLIPGVPSPLTG